MNTDQWIKLIQSLIPLLETLIWPILLLVILRHFGPSIKNFIERSGKFTGKISTSGIEITTEQLETTSQVSASLTAASISKETTLQISNPSDEPNSNQGNRSVLSSEKVLEIGYVVGQALDAQITKQLTKTTILWIEDNQRDNTFEKKALTILGVQIATCNTFEEALGKVQMKSYDIIISSSTHSASIQEDYLLLDNLNGRFNITYFIAYKPISRVEDKTRLIEKGGYGNTDQPLELFQLVVNAVEEIQAASITESAYFERTVFKWLSNTFDPELIEYKQSRQVPHLIHAIKKDGKKVGFTIYYRSSSFFYGLSRMIKRLQNLVITYKFDELVIVLVTPVESTALQLAAKLESLTDIPPKTTIIVGYLNKSNFEQISSFPRQIIN